MWFEFHVDFNFLLDFEWVAESYDCITEDPGDGYAKADDPIMDGFLTAKADIIGAGFFGVLLFILILFARGADSNVSSGSESSSFRAEELGLGLYLRFLLTFPLV